MQKKHKLMLRFQRILDKIAEVPVIKREILIEQLGRVLSAIYRRQIYGLLYAIENGIRAEKQLNVRNQNE